MLYTGGSLAGDLRIEGIPPFGIILKPAGKPCEDRILPAAAFVVIEYMVILILDTPLNASEAAPRSILNTRR